MCFEAPSYFKQIFGLHKCYKLHFEVQFWVQVGFVPNFQLFMSNFWLVHIFTVISFSDLIFGRSVQTVALINFQTRYQEFSELMPPDVSNALKHIYVNFDEDRWMRSWKQSGYITDNKLNVIWYVISYSIAKYSEGDFIFIRKILRITKYQDCLLCKSWVRFHFLWISD